MALKYKPEYTKAYYRYGMALRSLKKYKECIELLKERKEAELVQVRQAAEKELVAEEKLKEQKEEVVSNYKASIQQYCVKKGYRLIKRPEPIPGDVNPQLI